MFGNRKEQLVALAIVAIVLLGGLGLASLSWEDKDDGDKAIELSEDKDEDPKVMDILFDSESSRLLSTPLVVEDDPFLVLASTPAALWYENDESNMMPLMVDSEGPSADRFYQLYPHEEIVAVGDVSAFGETTSMEITGSTEEISLQLALNFWEESDGAILMEETPESYNHTLPGIVLASYLNIPVIISDGLSPAAREILDDLGVKYTLVFGEGKGYGTTIRFRDHASVENVVLQLLEARFGGLSYITLTNPRDLGVPYALPGSSSLAPYLSASHEGLVCAAPEEPIEDGKDFRMEEDAYLANETTLRVKEHMMETIQRVEEAGLLQDYLDDSPYLAIMGSAYTIPFHYSYLTPQGIMAAPEQNINDPALVPSDDIYADVDGDLPSSELAIARPIGFNLEDASALMARSLFYEEYMAQWVAESPVSQLLDASWQDSAFIHCGDDWNGYVLTSTPAYVEVYEYLNRHGYTTYTTIATGESVDDVTRFFQSSNMVFILAHGSETGFHMIDGYTAADVKNWWLGPSSFVVTSCNVGNTDSPNLTNIDNSIALAIIRSGVGAFYGGMRYEYTGVYNPNDEYPLVASGSPRLSQILIKLTTEQDLTSGIALRDAKNQYMYELDNGGVRDYDVAIKILYGDPLFNPYEP